MSGDSLENLVAREVAKDTRDPEGWPQQEAVGPIGGGGWQGCLRGRGDSGGQETAPEGRGLSRPISERQAARCLQPEDSDSA